MGQLAANLLLNGIVEGLITAIVALAIVVTYAVARFPNAAAGDYVTAGAYAGYLAYTKLAASLVAALACAAAAVGALSLAFYWLVFRRLAGKGFVAPLLASIGLAFLLRNSLTFWLGHDPLVFPAPLLRPWRLGSILVQPIDVVVAACVLVILALLYGLMRHTAIGREMRAIADNPELARVSGVRIERVLAVVWLVTGAVAGAGGFVLSLRTVIEPESGWGLLLSGFAGAILGGLTSFPGAVLGSLAIGVAQELSVPLLGGSYKLLAPFAVILAVLLARPAGLLGRVEAVR